MTTQWPDHLEVRALTVADAERISRWRYDGPWGIYNLNGSILDPDDGYLAVAGAPGGPLVGFCCHGAEARVPGLTFDPDLCDMGFGMDPGWVGRGHGAAFGGAVVDFITRRAAGRRLRAVVQTWNLRSLQLTRRLGFVEAGIHNCVQSAVTVEYAVMIRGGKPSSVEAVES